MVAKHNVSGEVGNVLLAQQMIYSIYKQHILHDHKNDKKWSGG